MITNLSGFSRSLLAGLAADRNSCAWPLLTAFLLLILAMALQRRLQSHAFPPSSERGRRWHVLLLSIALISGFAWTFAVLGALLSGLQSPWMQWESFVKQGTAFFIMAYGLRLMVSKKYSFVLAAAGALAIGSALAFAWIPCVGPILAAEFDLASRSATRIHGAALLFVYAFGMGSPFLPAGMLLQELLRTPIFSMRVLRWGVVLSGVFLIFLGWLMMRGNLLEVLRCLLVSTMPKLAAATT